MFKRIYDFIKSVDIYYKNAFRVYFLGTILSIIGGLFLSIYILFYDGSKWELEIFRFLLLNLFLIFMALNLESINFLKDNKLLRYLLICIILIASGIFVYDIIPIDDNSMDIKTLQYNAILLASIALFVSFNLRFNFYSFFDFVGSAFFAFGIFILFLILFVISCISIDFLFRVSFDEIYYVCCVCVATIFFVFFIGKVSSLNHYLVTNIESINKITDKRINNLFLIFSIFSYFYASILILYFALLFFGILSPQYSAIHLIIWFSFFSITLFWLNQSLGSKYLGKLFVALLFLLNIIALYSIIIRIYEYGFTPSRYFVLISCIFLFVSIILSLFGRNYLKIVFYLFAILCIFSTFGSLNAIKVSIDSQLRALKSLEMTKENHDRISSIYSFLIYYLDEDELADYKTFLNSYDDLHNKDNKTYRYYSRMPQVISVYGFDLFVEGVELDTKTSVLKGGNISFDLKNDSLIISRNEIFIKIDNFYDFMKKEMDKILNEPCKICPLVVEVKNGNKKLKLYIDYIIYDDEKKIIHKIGFNALLKLDSKANNPSTTKAL